MALPYFIEYLLTLQAPGGGRLAQIGVTQTVIRAFPPNTTLTYESRPMAGSYATIWFRSHFSPIMVPDAFSGWGQQYGASLMSGTITKLTIDEEASYFIVVTESDAYRGQLTNNSGLIQYFEGTTAFLTISSEENLRLVIEHLQKLNMGKMETLAAEANRLLGAIAKVYPPRRS